MSTNENFPTILAPHFLHQDLGLRRRGAGREANQVREIADRVNTWVHMRVCIRV